MCVACGSEFTRPPSAVKGVTRSYCKLECYRGDHERRSTVSREVLGPINAARAAERAEALRERAGRCGSPTCDDPTCDVRRGYCHRRGCNRKAAIAYHTSRTIRWVRDEPTLYCSRQCAVLDRNDGDVYRQERRELEALGYKIHVRHAAKILGRTQNNVVRHAQALGVGRQLRGDGPWRFRKDEVIALREEVARWNQRSWRKPDPGEWGRLASRLARVGPRPQYSPDEAENVLRLRQAGLSLSRIQIKSGLTRRQVRGILSSAA